MQRWRAIREGDAQGTVRWVGSVGAVVGEHDAGMWEVEVEGDGGRKKSPLESDGRLGELMRKGSQDGSTGVEETTRKLRAKVIAGERDREVEVLVSRIRHGNRRRKISRAKEIAKWQHEEWAWAKDIAGAREEEPWAGRE